jgi:uncharacterized protein
LNPVTWSGASPDIRPHLVRLSRVVRGHGPMVVACSGGVDSGLLAYVAHRALRGRMACVIGVSPSLADGEESAAAAFLAAHGIPFTRIRTRELEDARYRQRTRPVLLLQARAVRAHRSGS